MSPQYPSGSSLPSWFGLSLHAESLGSQSLAGILPKLLERFVHSFRFSHSQIEQLCKMAKDLCDWREAEALKTHLRQQLESLRHSLGNDLENRLENHLESNSENQTENRLAAEGQGTLGGDSLEMPHLSPQQRRQGFADFEAFYRGKRELLPNFQRRAPSPKVPKYRFDVLQEAQGPQQGGLSFSRGDRILGTCPVASTKTRCCNLLTLDAIQQCGFACSYCAIQHFYDEKAIQVRHDFAQKLQQLQLNPQEWYHIGTGQASDSLLWTEELGVLEPLIDFACRHPRVILELKSKSANVKSLLTRELPPNILFTWSLNPDNFIRHEELLTAPLDARLRAARQLADNGAKVGFHFHPIVRYQGWKTEYRQLAERLLGLFAPQEVVTVSLGTLTFSKSALKTIRHKAEQTQILRFPMQEIAGKFSYPYEVKRDMFRLVHQALEPWHGKVFFYLCMEDPALWLEVFGQQYADNREFEQDMLHSYARKMGLR